MGKKRIEVFSSSKSLHFLPSSMESACLLVVLHLPSSVSFRPVHPTDCTAMLSARKTTARSWFSASDEERVEVFTGERCSEERVMELTLDYRRYYRNDYRYYSKDL